MDEKSYNRQISDAIGPITSQDILDKYNITEYTVDDLVRDFEYAYSYKVEQARIFKILDAADHSDITIVKFLNTYKRLQLILLL